MIEYGTIEIEFHDFFPFQIGIIKESHDIFDIKTHRKPTFSDIAWSVMALVFYK